MENLQHRFFHHLKSQLPSHISLADEVAALLGISSDSAYRRIRNEKPISFDEVEILARHFKISLDQLLQVQSASGSFYSQEVAPENFDFGRYLEQTCREMELIAALKEKEIFYYCKDFPIFYYYAFPELAAFKHFIWMKTYLNSPELLHAKFSLNQFMKPLVDTGRKIFRAYSRIPGTEIMNIENVITTLLQIDYYRRSLMFGDEFVFDILLDKMEAMVRHICRQAEEGVKFLPTEKPTDECPAYLLYANDFVIGDNSVLGVFPEGKISFITHSYIHYIRITDASFTAAHHTYIKNIIKKSILISGTGERYRARFFHLIYKKIKECRNHQMETMG